MQYPIMVVWVTQPDRPGGMKDDVKQIRRAASEYIKEEAVLEIREGQILRIKDCAQNEDEG